jgi:outer membrane protein assembly factor BamA
MTRIAVIFDPHFWTFRRHGGPLVKGINRRGSLCLDVGRRVVETVNRKSASLIVAGDLVDSAGVGLRVFLPMFGLLGIDYGWGFDNIPGNPGIGNGKGQFHFTIGGQLGEL